MSTDTPTAASISSLRRLTADTTLFTLQCHAADGAATFHPGQFLELSLPGIGEVPISYCGIPAADGTIELCIRHVGHVTIPLLRARPGDVVGLRGPFGRGFPLEDYQHQELLLIAGGLGMAPLRSLLLARLTQRQERGNVTLLYAARDAGALLFLDELLALKEQGDIQLQLAVDHPGPADPRGCRVALLPELLEGLTIRPERTFAALCGPPAAYPGLVAGLNKAGLTDGRIHLSLERRMKCGQGRCAHCAIGPYLCCTDGPVFSSARLRGIEGALA